MVTRAVFRATLADYDSSKMVIRLFIVILPSSCNLQVEYNTNHHGITIYPSLYYRSWGSGNTMQIY